MTPAIEVVGLSKRFGKIEAVRGISFTVARGTTTALLGHLLSALGDAAQVGGNIGRPVLDLTPEAGVAVVEVSSYQIDLAPGLSPDVGALLNVTPDHIDRHGTFENYAAVKERLVANSRQAVIGVGVFAGLTAYDTQRIKEMYDVNDDGTVSGRKAVMGALSLYLDFINLFLMLLRLMGDRR